MAYQSTHTGAQVDEAVDKALSADAVPTPGSTNLVESGGVFGVVSNRNLLDNAWFRVNQRGATSGTGIAYIADRWFTSFGSGGVTWSRTDDTVTIQSTSGSSNAYIIQVIEQDIWSFLNGKTVTVSVMLNDYSVIHNTFVWNSESNQNLLIGKGLDDKEVRLETNVNQRRFAIRKTQTAETFRAAKLELGSVSTLANDAPPNFAEELAKCQRYYYRIAIIAYDTVAMGIISDSNNIASFLINFPVPMASAPTPSYSGTFGINSTQFGDATHHHTSTTPVRANAYFTASYTVPQGTAAALQDRGNGNAVMEFSADL